MHSRPYSLSLCLNTFFIILIISYYKVLNSNEGNYNNDLYRLKNGNYIPFSANTHSNSQRLVITFIITVNFTTNIDNAGGYVTSVSFYN